MKTGEIILIVALVCVVILFGVLFRGCKPDPKVTQLQEQLKIEQQQNEVLKKQNLEDHKRDSTALADYQKNQSGRDHQVQTIQKTSHEKIDHINSPDFTADSIRRAFANQ